MGPRAGRGAAHARSEPSTRCGEPPGPEHLRSEGGPTRRASGGPPRERRPQRHTSSCVCVSRTSFSDEATPAADGVRDGSRESQRASGPRPPPRRALQPFASPRGRGRGEGQAGTRSWGQRGRTFREKARGRVSCGSSPIACPWACARVRAWRFHGGRCAGAQRPPARSCAQTGAPRYQCGPWSTRQPVPEGVGRGTGVRKTAPSGPQSLSPGHAGCRPALSASHALDRAGQAML